LRRAPEHDIADGAWAAGHRDSRRDIPLRRARLRTAPAHLGDAMTRRMRVAAGLLAFAALAGACRQAQRSDTAAQPVDTRIEQRDSALTALSRTGWVASASGTGSGTAVANAIDGNATTRWRANVAQAANQFFQVDMGSQQTFAAIRLDTTTTPTEFPRSFKVQ